MDASADVVQNVGQFALQGSVRYLLWGGIAVYILGMIAVGLFASRKVKGMNDFLVAGRRLPLWMATATLLATWFGAGSSMGVAATVYSDGIGGVLADPFAASISLIIAGIFIVGMLRRLKCLTVTDVIERKYGRLAGVYTSLWMIPVYIGWLGAQMLGMGTILHVLTGMDKSWGTVLGACVVLIYTFAGGMWAVTMTDVIQVTLIILGLFLIIPGAIGEAGGWQAAMSRVSASDLTLGINMANPGFEDWIYYIGSWIIMGLGCAVGQDVMQRALSSRTDKIAVSSSVISGFLYMAIGLVPITIGFTARIVLAKYGISAETMGGDLENQVLPRMAMIILGNMHPLILTVFLAALISAIMSSADSSLLAGSSLFCNNVLRPFFPNMTNHGLLLTTRITTVAMTVVSMYLALNVESIYRLMVNSWASQLVVVFLPVMTALYVPKASKNTAWATMIVGTATWLAYAFICSAGAKMGFTELMNSDLFDRALTNGAVYGFFAGLLAFLFTYAGERIPCLLLGDSSPEDEDEAEKSAE